MNKNMSVVQLQEWHKAAVADNWSVNPGPWADKDGNNPSGDRSVVLTREDAEVWLVCRDLGGLRAGKVEVWMAGWFENGQRSIEVPDSYDPNTFWNLRGLCNYCHRVVDAANLRPVVYAGRICPDCDTEEFRNKMAKTNWSN